MDTWKTVKAEALKGYVQHYFEALDIRMDVQYADLQDSILHLRNRQVDIDATIDVSTPEKEAAVDDELYGVMRSIRDYQKLCYKKTGIKLDPAILITKLDPDDLAVKYVRGNDLQALAVLYLNDEKKKGDIEAYKRKLQEEYADEAV